MADILITGGVLIPVDPKRQILADGAVAIEKDRIVDVGPTEAVTARHQAPTVIDAKGKAILPGLIDVHSHAGHGLVKTMGGGDPDLWADACEIAYSLASTPEFWHAEAQLAALERLRFGVTTGVSLFGGGNSIMRSDDPAYGDAHCEGVLGVGTRSVVAVGPTRPPFPRTYATWNGDVRNDRPVQFEQQRETCRTLLTRWDGAQGRRISIAMLTPTLAPEHRQALGEALFAEAVGHAREIYAIAREHDVLFTQDGHIKGSILMAEEIGILGPRTLLSHCIDLLEEEIQLCARTDTRIAHNPSAIRSIQGRCPATELIEAGVVVAIGSDGTAPDRSGDMFRHMQQCMHYHRTFFRDPTWLPPGKVLEMCTIDAARALGMEKEIGSLEIGKKADVTLVNLRRPHIYPAQMPEFHLIYFANGNDVDTVVVDGRIALQGGKALFVNEDSVLDAAQSEAEKLISRGNLDHYLHTPPTFWNHVRATDQIRS